MQIKLFVGVDVSKDTLDYSVVSCNKELFSLKTSNDLSGIQTFLKELKMVKDFDLDKTVFCMEFTGIYNNHLLKFLHIRKANIWMENPIHIKRSCGLQRGKNDKVDALRIAMFAYKNREEMKLWEPKRESIQKLKAFSVIRKRIIGSIKQLSVPLNEMEGFVDKKMRKSAEKFCSGALKALKNDLQIVEESIAKVIKEDQRIYNLHSLITSVKGIGTVTATEIIVATNEFKDISDPKKFASYSGVAPFEHSSGSSIRGRTRVSKMSNRSINSLLYMAALSAISHDKELKDYYERKVGDGKNQRLVLNAVKNKLILRVFACVSQNRKYEKNYINKLV